MCVLFAALPFCAVGAGVPSSDSVPPSEWPVVGRTGDNHHFSPLRQVNDKNVSRLGLAWYADIPSKPGLVGTPIVVDGVVYQSAQRSVVFANDVRTGRLLWTFDPKLKFKGEMIPTMGSHVNRGVGVWKDKVYVGTGDCRLIAINRTTGKPAWEADVCVGDSRFAITGAPRVAAGKVFIGPANLDDGSRRGFLDAYDAETGKRLWRFYTVPGDPSKGFENKAMEMASKTWGKDYWKRAGSGSVIEGITYDPVLKLVYFGTTSASPDLPQDRGEGRNGELFTASIVAVDADTGEYRWHYQQTPNNGWNYDSYQPITIATLPFGGKQRRVLMHAPKNGFFYVLDAATGKLLAADKYGVRVNWASSVDVKTGRPARNAGVPVLGDRALDVFPKLLRCTQLDADGIQPADGFGLHPRSRHGRGSHLCARPEGQGGRVRAGRLERRTRDGSQGCEGAVDRVGSRQAQGPLES